MNLYHVRNIDEGYYDSPFVMADSVEKAWETAKNLPDFSGVINEAALEDEAIQITEFIPENWQVCHYLWDYLAEIWEINTTSTVHF